MINKLLHADILAERLTPESALQVGRHPIKIWAESIRSLYNVGSLFRTCDSALADELIMTGYTPHPPRPEIEKTALGAVNTVPWRYFEKNESAIEYLKSKSVKIIAVEITDKKRTYDTFRKDEFPMCLVLGNELTGLSDNLLKMCDDAIEIPMYGVKHSLNVSVAAGIPLFEAVRAFRSFNPDF